MKRSSLLFKRHIGFGWIYFSITSLYNLFKFNEKG